MAYPIEGYILKHVEYIDEIDSEAIIYIHEKTKAKLLVMPNADAHKSFCIGFRTPPSNSTGVAHIIEHSVLCGSRKYDLKDPFVELSKGSLNTYLNAMTYPDKTLYPISSQNDKDFKNLMDVYLDAVFFPNIYKSKDIMMQEGWRYHLENEEDPIEYKGVVYNEMKGAFSSPEELGFRMIKETLFPETTYANESGGSPTHIPELSYEEFIQFHKNYYHPSNSYICLYGDMDVRLTLEYMDKEYLSKFDALEIDSHIATQAPFAKAVERTGYYSAAPDKEQGLFVSYNLVVGEVTDRELMLAMSILEYILLDTPGSPLKKALIAEGIGEDVYGAYQTHLKQPIFSIVAKNVNESKKARFYELIGEVLRDLVKNGLPEHLVRGALQVKEFELREGDASGYSRGLFYSIAALKNWIYEGTPCAHLKYEKELKAIKKAAGSGYFENLIETYLLNNNHVSKVVLYPKVGLAEENENIITEKLKAYKASLSKEEIKELIKRTKQFNAFQEAEDSKEAIEAIPLLEKSDLRREVKYPNYHVHKQNETAYVITTASTHEIAYMNWHISLEGIEDIYMPYLGMIVGMLGKLDTANYDYESLSSYMDEHIGSASYSIQGLNSTQSEREFLPVFQMHTKALASEMKAQVGLMTEILQHTSFENEKRLLEIIREMKAFMESGISSDGHRVAYGRLLAHLTAAEDFEEKTKGVKFYHLVCDIEKNWETRKGEVITTLQKAYSYLNNKKRITIGITIDEELVDEAVTCIDEGLKSFREENFSPLSQKFVSSKEQEALIYPTNVNYVAAGYNFKKAGFNYHGSMQMLKNILSMKYLWSRVRVQNGAYGCFCDFRRSGNIFFVSYRDPNIKQTLDIYKEVADFVEQMSLSERELLQYLIGTISQLDFPFTPATEGKTAQIYYLTQTQKEVLQKSRDELFETTNEILQGFAPLLKACMDENMYCVFGNNQSIEQSGIRFDQITAL